MSELKEFKKVVSPIAYGLAYKSELGTTEYQQLYAEEDVIKYFNNKPQLTIHQSIAKMLDFIYDNHFDFNDDVSWVIANIDFLPTDDDYYSFNKWINQSVDNHNLALAYLAGKALGVDLVKVV